MIGKIFVEEGIKKVRMNEYFKNELERAGYGGMDIKRTPMGTQITVYVEKPGMIIGKQGKRIKRITEEISERHDMDNPQIDVQLVETSELSAPLMADRLAKLIERGWHFRRAGRSLQQRIMDANALGCEITISGKLRGRRSRVEKIVNGCIKHCGSVVEEIIEEGYAIAKKRSGVIGVKVRITRPDAKMPDVFRIEVNKDKDKEKEIKEIEEEVREEVEKEEG